MSRTTVERLMVSLGQRATGAGRIYLTGGATAVWVGWRETTHDIDLRLDPEPPGIFEAIAHIKEELDVSVELASPADFIPELPGWRDRSEFVARHGDVDFFHFDAYSQVLSKIERGHTQDLIDARALVDGGRVEPQRLFVLYGAIEPALIRFPSIDPASFRQKVQEFIDGLP